MNDKERLTAKFFQREPATVARELLGCGFARQVDRQWIGGWIVETEAYLADGDAASHSSRGPTPGNASMFGEPGTLYVYPIHAKHCVNLVTEPHGVGSAVLIRAIEPVWGVDVIRSHRGQTDDRRLTSGPGMICQALAINRTDDGIHPFMDARWRLFESPGSPMSSDQITTTTRIGISQSTELPLRFFVDGNRYVSGLARQHRRPRRETIGKRHP